MHGLRPSQQNDGEDNKAGLQQPTLLGSPATARPRLLTWGRSSLWTSTPKRLHRTCSARCPTSTPSSSTTAFCSDEIIHKQPFVVIDVETRRQTKMSEMRSMVGPILHRFTYPMNVTKLANVAAHNHRCSCATVVHFHPEAFRLTAAAAAQRENPHRPATVARPHSRRGPRATP